LETQIGAATEITIPQPVHSAYGMVQKMNDGESRKLRRSPLAPMCWSGGLFRARRLKLSPADWDKELL